jgi:hypothetical protein
MTIFDVKGWSDLVALRQEAGLDTGSGRPTWALVEEVRDHGLRPCRPGPEEEISRMACRVATRNADPGYRGYTPFGEIN